VISFAFVCECVREELNQRETDRQTETEEFYQKNHLQVCPKKGDSYHTYEWVMTHT